MEANQLEKNGENTVLPYYIPLDIWTVILSFSDCSSLNLRTLNRTFNHLCRITFIQQIQSVLPSLSIKDLMISNDDDLWFDNRNLFYCVTNGSYFEEWIEIPDEVEDDDWHEDRFEEIEEEQVDDESWEDQCDNFYSSNRSVQAKQNDGEWNDAVDEVEEDYWNEDVAVSDDYMVIDSYISNASQCLFEKASQMKV
jgi:hypothetical protein